MDPSVSTIIWYGFTAAAAVQIGYYLFFFSRLAFYRLRADPPDSEAGPEVSVVICAKNDNRSLTNNLPVILQQRYENHEHQPRYEVLLVNDNSEDETRYTLQRLEPGYPHFRYLNLTQSAKGIPGKKYPLTMGIRGARFDCLLLTDADCRPAGTHWLGHMAAGFDKDKEIVLGYGAYERQRGLLNKVIRFETFFSAQQFLSFALAGLPYMGVGRNLAYRKALFFLHKGFLSHHNLPSGDDDLFVNQAATRTNTRVVIHPDAITYSVPKTTWGAWYRQKTRHMSTAKHYRFIHSLLLGVFSLSQGCYYPLFIAGLWLAPAHRDLILVIFAGRLLLQLVFWPLSLKKLNEKGLLGYCLVFDMFLWLYYLVFTAALIRKPRLRWN